MFRTHRTRPNSESIVLLDGDVDHRINPTNRVRQESRRDCQTLLSVGFNLLAR